MISSVKTVLMKCSLSILGHARMQHSSLGTDLFSLSRSDGMNGMNGMIKFGKPTIVRLHRLHVLPVMSVNGIEIFQSFSLFKTYIYIIFRKKLTVIAR